jgi:glycosyltransferase involved in cell wall biosynthesis
VCVVVPAHNEAANIARLIESLRQQDLPSARFVLALDRCTDDTASIAQRAIEGDTRFEIIEINQCPQGWAGKVNAAWTGVQRSAGARDAAYLVFSDADCAFHPGCLRACVALIEERNLDLLSLLSTLSSDHWFEAVVQPAATMELMRQYPLLRANRHDERQRPFANGQFMMFRAAAYTAIGGHEAVREALLEDIAFARLIAARGFRSGLLLADGIVRCRMYDSWPQFKTGWKRIYIEASNRKSRRLSQASRRARLTGSALPALGGASLVGGLLVDAGADPLRVAAIAFGGIGLIIWTIAMLCVARAGRTPWWAIVFMPFGCWMVGGVLARAARELASGVPTRWGGRDYVLVDRSKP